MRVFQRLSAPIQHDSVFHNDEFCMQMEIKNTSSVEGKLKRHLLWRACGVSTFLEQREYYLPCPSRKRNNMPKQFIKHYCSYFSLKDQAGAFNNTIVAITFVYYPI